MDITALKIRDMRTMLDKKEISAAELTDAYLDRIDKTDGSLESYITVTADEAKAAAVKAQQVIDDGNAGVLTGIPLAIKDNICTDGIKTTCASRILENFVPPYNATVMEKLNAEGIVMLGKAVAAKECFYALGSDTGGSIRQPASFCGVTGLKPTYGRVSRYGLVAFASSLDQIGPVAKDAHDCAIILNAISGYDYHDGTSAKLDVPDFTAKIGQDIKGIKIAMPKEFYAEGIDSDVREAVENAAKWYEQQGEVIDECSMPSL